MPSDQKKQREAKKKAMAKTKHVTKKDALAGDEDEQPQTPPNGSGTNTPAELTNGSAPKTNGKTLNLTEEEELVAKLEHDMELNAEARSCTGVLGIHPRSRDIKIDNFSITFHGAEILTDTKVELNCGRRYGLIGPNGSGKSTLLAALGRREVPVQVIFCICFSRLFTKLNFISHLGSHRHLPSDSRVASF